MINTSKIKSVYIANEYVDFRKSINGLVAIITTEFKLTPDDDCLFIFCSKTRDKIKIIHYDLNGYWLYYKVLDNVKFKWPNNEQLLEYKMKDLKRLLMGFAISQANGFRKNKTEYL